MVNPTSMLHNVNFSVRTGAWISLIGFILSAPVAVAIVMLVAPQPSWMSVEIFKANYQSLQELPYYFGFILVAGLILLVYAHKPENYQHDKSIQDQIQIAHVLIIIFATLIIFNYICQTTLVPHLVRAQTSIYDPVIAVFTMSNPDSLSWSLEMWGYLVLAIALWLLGGCYRGKKTILPALLTVNLFLSFISLAWAIFDPGWVETTLGLVLYFTWNALMIMILILIYQRSKDQPAI